MSSTNTKIEEILFPYLLKETQRIVSEDTKFVHYTSSENAVNIIKSRSLWMRNTTCMNDYLEVKHGYRIVGEYLDSKYSQDKGRHCFGFRDELETLMYSAIQLFQKIWSDSEYSIYIASLSEHCKDEDEYGRLSMWRAYGGGSESTALVLNNPAPTKDFNLFMCPACYSETEASTRIDDLIKHMKSNEDYLISLDDKLLVNHILLSLILMIVSIKHTGFKEEKEWRVIYLPTLFGADHRIDESIEVVGGIPQTVFKIPLDGKKVPNLCISKLIEKLIIGPSNYPMVQLKAFQHLLKEFNTDVGGKIAVSQIPLRM